MEKERDVRGNGNVRQHTQLSMTAPSNPGEFFEMRSSKVYIELLRSKEIEVNALKTQLLRIKIDLFFCLAIILLLLYSLQIHK
jgi:hypothetical protein